MAITVTTVLSRADMGVFDVAWGADADVSQAVPHGITGGLFAGGGVVPEVAIVTPQPTAPGTAAAQRLGDVRVSAVDATNVTLSKTNAGGSSPITTRLVVLRKSQQLSAVNTAVLGAVVGAIGGADASA